MMKFNKAASALGLILTLATPAALAHEGKVAIGPKISLLQGIGLEGRMPMINEQLFGRLGVTAFWYNHTFNNGDIEEVSFKGKLTLLAIPLMVDYHPFDNGFRMSLGAAYNGSKIELKANLTKNIKIDGKSFTPQQIGNVSGKMQMGNKLAPVLSIGYDSSFFNESAFSFDCELGAMYVGTYKAKLKTTGMIGTLDDVTKVINYLNDEANKDLKNIKKYLQFHPIISIGFKYRF